MSDRTDILLAIQRHFPKESLDALAYFTELNTNARGADWADALDMLLESNAHCDITDMVYEDLRPMVPLGDIPYIAPMTLTLMYAKRGLPPFSAIIAFSLGWLAGKQERETDKTDG